MGVDPLSFATDILVVTVIDAEVFDEIFDGLVSGNVEGTVVRGGSAQGFSFDESTLHRLIADEPMQAAGAAALTLAWQCRSKILSV